ncbi:MAG: hypothetical protein OEX04_03485 [Acidimicrobiia bacterium]|nr:hypothetical protein [Acidimicrobiia bacterium]MDH4306519.1 hypothetical protein [Acidimicrobiia bacterium]
MSRSRYSRWDGSQDPFGADLPVDDLADQLAEDVLDGWGIDAGLRRLLEQGMEGRFDGLRALRERLDRMRQDRTAGRPDPFADIRPALEEVEGLEREALAADPSEEARFAELDLDTLPDNTAARIRELRDHEWRSSEARERFEKILDDLRRQMLDASFRNIADGMQEMSGDDMAAVKDMLSDLNNLMEQRRQGMGPSQEQFEEFMNRHGEFFPENPRTFDELLETLARRSMAMSRYMASLDADQRRELNRLMDDLMSDMDLAFQMDQLGENLRALAPSLPWDDGMAMGGEPVGLAEGLDAVDQASRLDELERALGQDYAGASLEDIDEDDLRAALGEDAVRDVRRLRQIEKMLEDAGVIARTGGRLELTPRGVRKLGERALTRVFDRLKLGQPGSHETAAAGGIDEPTGQSRPWRFGDPFRLDLRKTIHNAVLRSGPSTGGVRLHPDDFEVEEAEHRTSTATVLLLDMSRSMPLRGHWVGAKRMALALHTLITTTYPEDSIEIVGFSDYARRMTPADLAEVDWEPVYGTNMEHAFNLAGRILSKHRDAARQVLLVTDGEPTAHLEGEYVYFNWPPVRETLDKTYKEAMRLAKSGVTMNIFMLEDTPGLVGFIDRLAQIVGGRVFTNPGDDLGDLVVADYVTRR